MNNNKLYYPSLNGLRAISITLVILNHLSIKENIFSGFEKYSWLKLLKEFLEDGQLGVNIFFVISGFLITSLMLNEEQQRGSVSIKQFYIRRILRIFPAYYFMLLVYFLLQSIGFIHLSNSSWITSITYTKYLNWTLDGITCHAWSLSIEENFYLLWPLIFVSGIKFRKFSAVSITIIIPFIRLYLAYNPVSWIDEFSLFTRIDSIAIGCLFAFFKDKIIDFFKNMWGIAFFLSLIAILLIEFLPEILNDLNLNFISPMLGTRHGTIASILIGIIIFYSAFGPKNKWHGFLNLPFMNYLGMISYSLYLWQQIFTNNTKYWVTDFPFNILLMSAMTFFSYYFVEKPFLKIKNRL